MAPAALITRLAAISVPSDSRTPVTLPFRTTISSTVRRTAVHPPASATVASISRAILDAPPTG